MAFDPYNRFELHPWFPTIERSSEFIKAQGSWSPQFLSGWKENCWYPHIPNICWFSHHEPATIWPVYIARSVSITQEQSKSWDASRHLGHVAKLAPRQTTWPQLVYNGCHSGFVWNWGIPSNCHVDIGNMVIQNQIWGYYGVLDFQISPVLRFFSRCRGSSQSPRRWHSASNAGGRWSDRLSKKFRGSPIFRSTMVYYGLLWFTMVYYGLLGSQITGFLISFAFFVSWQKYDPHRKCRSITITTIQGIQGCSTRQPGESDCWTIYGMYIYIYEPPQKPRQY